MDLCKALPKLPTYQKCVQAFKIKTITNSEDRAYLIGEGLTLAISKEYLSKYNPQPGGYYVLYQNLGEYYIPAEDFESEYTLLTN
jgi:sulfur transfer complex TusBCD TusB component (DsrH family)